MTKSLILTTSLFLSGTVLCAQLFAQSQLSAGAQASDVTARADKTIIEFELLGTGALSGDKAHRWAETLQKLGAGVRVRQPTVDDEPGVTEKTRGTLRWVKVLATLDTSGDIVLPDRRFSTSDTELLKEWIDELKLYGVQGAPAGKPLWGLSEAQFNMLFAALSEPISQNTDGEALTNALEQLRIPEAYALRFHSTAARHMSQLKSVAPVRQRLVGMSSGTGLAILLADYGLGFRPLRTPSGEIEFVIEPLDDIRDPWPVGWELRKEMLRHQLAPELFEIVPVKFDNLPLADILDDIARTTGTPIVVDHYAVEQKGIDLAGTTMSYPSKKTAWIMIINSVAARHHMTQQLRIDEREQPFVRIAPFVPQRPAD